MLDIKLNGIYPALVTPFAADESVDEAGLRRLVRHLSPDVDGFVVNGTTGDFPLLSYAERRRTIEIVADEARSGCVVIAGTGAIGTRETLALTQAAFDAGAHAALVVAPYYLRPRPAGIFAHYATLADEVPEMPLVLYNFPQLVGQPIPVDVVAELVATHENVVGLKDTSGDMRYMLALLETLPGAFNVLVGQGTLVLPALAMGATGAVLAAGNLIPAAYQRLRQTIEADNLAAARALQHRIYPVAELVGRYGSLAVRAGLEIQGLEVGEPRLPLRSTDALTAEERARLRDALADVGNL